MDIFFNDKKYNDLNSYFSDLVNTKSFYANNFSYGLYDSERYNINLINIEYPFPARTDSSSMKQKEDMLRTRLDNNSDSFINLLLHEDFEDGRFHPAVDYVISAMKESPYVTCIWLDSIYNKYKEKDLIIVSGILRIIAQIKDKSFFYAIKDNFILIVENVLSSNSVYEQEAGLMVLENWRGEDSYKILDRNLIKQDSILYNYSQKLKDEIGEEINNY